MSGARRRVHSFRHASNNKCVQECCALSDIRKARGAVRITGIDKGSIKIHAERMPDRIQARHYVDKLDDSRFSGLKLQLHNNLLMDLAATFPTTLLDAYDLAENYKVPTRQHASSGRDSHTKTVFAATLHENRHVSESKPKAGKKGGTRNSERVLSGAPSLKVCVVNCAVDCLTNATLLRLRQVN